MMIDCIWQANVFVHFQPVDHEAMNEADKDAAARVELVLPETGVCTRGGVEAAGTASGCCGGPAKEDLSACCAADETAKKAGASGCGCS